MAEARLFDGGRLAGIVEGFTALEWTRSYYGQRTFRLEASPDRARAVRKGLSLQPPDEPRLLYLIETIDRADGEGTPQGGRLTATGRCLGGMFAARPVEPPAGQGHDRIVGAKPETAMKYYVNGQAGPAAPEVERVPGLAVAPDRGRPVAASPATYEARYQYLGDWLAEIGQPAGLGWEIAAPTAGGDQVFQVLEGRDRSAAVTLSFDRESLKGLQWLTSDAERATVAIALGQGEMAARAKVVRWLGQDAGAPEPRGLARRKIVLDARDLDTLDGLRRRADAALAEANAPDRCEATINAAGPFRYRDPEHGWDLGDLVMVEHRDWDLRWRARVVAVTRRIAGEGAAPTVEVALDRPLPDLRERLRGGGNGTARS